jgi:cellulose synthase/poly-beta-1,6-N-acetylglucosamine synthase-like glycosyltransferase
VAFLAFNNLRPRGRARLGLSAGLLGNGFALTAPVLQRVPFASAALAEDVEHHVRLLRAGYSVLWAEDTWVAAEMPVRASAAATQRARWEGGRGRLAIDWVPCLLRAVARGNSGLLEPLLELLLLPLTFHVLLLTLLLALPLPATQLYATLALTVVILHVALALAVGGATWRDVLVIGLVPLYLLWKLATLPAVMRSAARNAPWRRTERA